jgi:hypothetical protein
MGSEAMTPLTLTERDVLGANAATGNVSTFSTETQLIEWRAGQRRSAPGEVEYLISARGIQTPRQRIEPTVSPAWFGRVKNGLKALVGLPVGWDTYGGLPADPRVAGLAAELIEWFAVVGVPPPDVFASGDGGVQLEWHIKGVDVTIAFSASDEETTIYYHDLSASGDPWFGPASEGRLRNIRRRLLDNP